ncbi:MAG: SoxR reducing system RseC family protein [Clostridia bacterium]|nr:SoxR reducing system RseC family protein [Clostridia bacterium]
MTRTGFVERIADGLVTVVLADASCEGCSTPCGACRREQKPQRAAVESLVDVSVGDRVELTCPSGGIVLYSVCMFLIPLFIGVGLCVGLMGALGEGTAALVAALGALLSFFAAALVFSTPAMKRKNAFRISRVLTKNALEKELDKQ